MKYSAHRRKVYESLPALLLGLAAFVLVTGGKIIRPRHADWLMELDPATAWLGWEFFRSSPLLQWPIGANPSYGMEIGSSIVFTDSIPLLAFLFKPLSPFLPDVFQYLGLWILICFLLQSFFAWKLLSLFTRDKWLPLIGSIFFTLAPAALWRLYAHYSLFGHWVLLAALYLYFSNRFSYRRWVGLLTITALIHAYLLAMVIAVWVADLWQRGRQKELVPATAIRLFLFSGMLTAVIMWGAGYFMVGAAPGTTAPGIGSFGFYRMNLLSPLDPEWGWSRLLRDQKQGIGDNYEGFNYLGLGILGLGIIAAYELLRKKALIYSEKILPLVVLSAVLSIYAISNNIGAGNYEILTYDLPPIVASIAKTFRASGRFFWPVYYLIYLAIFFIIFSMLERWLAITCCTALLIIQIADTSIALRSLHTKLAHPPSWSSPMRSPLWNDIARRYRRIVFVLPHNLPSSWMALSHFAATHRMAINTGYFARVDPEKEQHARLQVASSIMNGQLDADSLYVFEDEGLWKVALNQVSSLDVAGNLDGFRIVAPKLKACEECNQSEIKKLPSEAGNDFDYHMERLSILSKGT